MILLKQVIINVTRMNMENSLEERIYREAKFPKLKIIGQFNKTYVLAEYDSTLYLIDQHATHEKILF